MGGQRDTESLDARIAALARSQHGVMSRAQVIDAGMSRRQIDVRVQTGRLEYVLPAVLRISGSSATSRQAAKAATLWAGDGAVLSHGAAGVLWGMEGVRAAKPEVWVQAPRNPRSRDVTVHRGTRLDRADRANLDGIPITTPTRTLIDVSGRLEDDALLGVLEYCLRHDLTTPERLAARLEALRSSGRVGGGRLQALLSQRPAGAAALESRLEARVWRLIESSGLPLPRRQHPVVVDGRRYRLDFAWPTHGVAVECDGWAYHGRARFEADERRRADLASIAWLAIPVTWRQCSTDPAAIIARLERTLRARAIRREDSLSR
jgi:very-short-patch-repair endonuclease